MKELPITDQDVPTQKELTLVIGGTGKTGRRIVDGLRARGKAVRSGGRSTTVPFDWGNRDTWRPALHGVSSVYISYYPDLAVPGAADDIARLVTYARQAGVAKLVLLSGRGEEEAQHGEKLVRESGLRWTIVRCSWFNQNFSEAFFRDFVTDGVIALPTSGIAEPFVDVEDIADVAVAALSEAGHDGEVYELTGPELLTFPEVAAKLSAAVGREIRFESIAREAFIEGMKSEGLGDDYVNLVDYLVTTVLDGRNARCCDGVRRALGRDPRDFDSYAIRAAASGVWNLEAAIRA